MAKHPPLLKMKSTRFIQNDCSIFIEKFTLKENFPLHTHDYIELEVFLSGTGTNRINDIDYPIKRGLFTLYTPYDKHEIIIEQPVTGYKIVLDISSVNTEFYKKYNILNSCCICYPQKANDASYVISLYNLCFHEYENQRRNIAFSEIAINDLINTILIQYIRYNSLLENVNTNSSYLAALTYINENYAQNITLKDVADHVFLNPNYFCSMFKKCHGKSFNEYLTEIRVKTAKGLLKTTNNSILDISEKCGFDSLSNFCRVFKKETGKSPSEYRKYKKVIK